MPPSPIVRLEGAKESDIKQRQRHVTLIHAYAREHNYKPNVLAVNLSRKPQQYRRLLSPTTGTPLFLRIERNEKQRRCRYNIIVAQSSLANRTSRRKLYIFRCPCLGGVIKPRHAKDTLRPHQELLNNEYSIVFYDRICTGLKPSEQDESCRLLCSRNMRPDRSVNPFMVHSPT